MTDTAQLADIVLPATMFLEHDDLYRGGGHQHVLLGPKVVEPPPTVRTNLFVIEELAKRLGVADCPGFGLTERQHIDRLLANYGIGYDEMKERKWLDCQPAFEEAHFLNGFAHPDGRFRFKADWTGTPAPNRPPEAMGAQGPHGELPEFPDHVDLIEVADERHPFRLATSPARSFLNSTFAETPSSIQKEGRPEVMIHAEDAAELGIAEGDVVRLGNGRGEIRLHAKIGGGARRGVVIAEGLWPNGAHLDGEGINVLTGADAVAPYGGAAFHDNRVWMRRT
jgi:anaerobic selenocysteine-containing dehydrogenase